MRFMVTYDMEVNLGKTHALVESSFLGKCLLKRCRDILKGILRNHNVKFGLNFQRSLFLEYQIELSKDCFYN